ncbi:hypothetical protein [Pseudonocardia sp. GCM10023141]|uniref:hypothetical protein n=1 Tax=Pseudonocardia sp. GCM10023141 TaxID=3252653 RepID=UPI00360B491C
MAQYETGQVTDRAWPWAPSPAPVACAPAGTTATSVLPSWRSDAASRVCLTLGPNVLRAAERCPERRCSPLGIGDPYSLGGCNAESAPAISKLIRCAFVEYLLLGFEAAFLDIQAAPTMRSAIMQ